jgi:tellurite resistance protein
METEARINILARVAQSPSVVGGLGRGGEPVSILSLAAAAYGTRPSGDATVPTGFDPVVATLFEAIVEGAYIVANADGIFDEDERRMFEKVVVAACSGIVDAQQIEALVSDLGDQLREDGVSRRIETVARSITKKEHAREVLRVAALLAQASDDVSPVERDALAMLAERCGLGTSDVESAFADVRKALGGAAG